MAAEGNGTFLALESLGNQSAKALVYAQSGKSSNLSNLASSGGTFRHATVAVTVPMQKLFFTVNVGGRSTGRCVVPLQRAVGYGGENAKVTVPLQTLVATGTVMTVGRAALTVPVQTMAAHALVGLRLGAALIVPMQTLSSRMGARATLAVPMQIVAAHAWLAPRSTAALRVPLQSATGTMSVSSYPSRAALVVPMIVAGPYVSARLSMPMQYMTGTFVLPAGYEAWVMNIRNNGVTRWTNFPFTQFARVGSTTYAVGSDGNLYQLGGDLDVTTPIQWTWETGLSDLDSPGIKHIPYLYMDGIIDGTIEITLIDDRGREFMYEYDTQSRGAVHQPHRRKLGNGIRARSVAVRLGSVTGAYAEIDSLEPEATITQRSI